ncbi:hypothetical protein PISMIDRAFT_406437 [Pisolithus microcarpus 441]|uniref:Unplaced genomic scaffold scaffold_319, whole genome shotgun sequence n=1 Tax=Pisolithus microcarpus 441 TaxID=765257 RepID=A0A0C9YZP3_9AGAM|nr:hypothetical protein PISMIDRAFT_406437 [Pisolithus microcarpus 441]
MERGGVMQRTPRSCTTNISPIKACISSSASTPRSLMGPHARWNSSLHVSVKRLWSFHVIQICSSPPTTDPDQRRDHMSAVYMEAVQKMRGQGPLCGERVSEAVRSYRRR